MARSVPFVIMQFSNYRSDEIFNHAIKPAVKKSLSLTDDEVERIRVDQSVKYDYGPGRSMPYVPEKILNSIKECSFVICDTTGNRPNCYFELGYALAHQKYVILVHEMHSEQEPHFDLRGYPYYLYQGIDDLKTELERRIKFVFGEDHEIESHPVSDFFERCKLPIVLLDGEKNYEYRLNEFGNSRIQIVQPNKKFKPSSVWLEVFNKSLKRHLEYAEKNGCVLWNGDLVRLKDYHPLRDEATGDRFLRLDVEQSDYYTFISSNYSWEFLTKKERDSLRKYELENILNLKDSALCNPLTVSVSLVIQHKGINWILIQRRNIKKVSHARQEFMCSAAGMVSLQRDNTTHGIDVYRTVINEVEEELGIRLREDQIAIRGLIRETNCFEVTFVAEAEIPSDPDKILEPSADSFEVKKVYACKLTPEDYAIFIKNNGGIGNFTPAGVSAIIFSLMKRFPFERIEDCMRNL